MPNGYTCPTCGSIQPAGWQGTRMGPWRGAPMGAEPAWGAGPGWFGAGWTGPWYGPYHVPGPGWAAGPGWGYGPSYTPAYYGGLPTDSEIEEMIYDSIDADPLIPFDANIDVSVEAGTVYLRGEVPSKRIKHAAGDDAWWIPGVVDVHNEIKVAPRRRAATEEAAKQQAQSA